MGETVVANCLVLSASERWGDENPERGAKGTGGSSLVKTVQYAGRNGAK
jgi:hypothetical protein